MCFGPRIINVEAGKKGRSEFIVVIHNPIDRARKRRRRRRRRRRREGTTSLSHPCVGRQIVEERGKIGLSKVAKDRI